MDRKGLTLIEPLKAVGQWAIANRDYVESSRMKYDRANANGAKADARWIFPKVDFRDATFREAVEFLAAKSKTLDPTGIGANIVTIVAPCSAIAGNAARRCHRVYQ